MGRVLILYSLAHVCLLIMAAVAEPPRPWLVEFTPSELLGLPISHRLPVEFKTTDLEGVNEKAVVTVESDRDDIAYAGEDPDHVLILVPPPLGSSWTGAFNVTGNFLGYARLRLRVRDKHSKGLIAESRPLTVTVVRIMRVVDYIFMASVSVLVAIIYINFGCALDWEVLRRIAKKPIGPAIGFASQFVFMPLISFGLGKLVFPDSIQMQLGMFFTGVSPGGGGSNVWTFALDGNLSLSMAMTTISTFAAFVMMPLWIFTLGQLIFNEGNITIPYFMIGGFALALVFPLSVGFLIQRYLPRVSKFMLRVLKPFCIFFLLFVIIFATATNFYLFKLFSWRIVIAGLGLPWIGFLLGMMAACILRQPTGDVIAIAIETGIQNTGIAIFLLQALGQPDADLTSAVPLAVSMMTPFPLIALLIVRKWRTIFCRKENTDDIKKCPPEEEEATKDSLI